MSGEEWGPWIEHDGNGCPCPGKWIHFVIGEANDGSDPECDGGVWEGYVFPLSETEGMCIARCGAGWTWDDGYFPIIRYRIRKPRALRDLIELVENLPAPVREGVDA